MKIKICADSTCDLSAELVEKYDISIMPLKVILGEKTYSDGVDITPQDIFKYVAEKGSLPKTAAPSPEEYRAFFKSFLKEYDAVIHINISSKTSSAYANAYIAASGVKGAYVVDSLALSTGQGLLVLKACDFAAEGLAPEQIIKKVEELRPKVNTSFVPDALDYLHKGGRCSLASLMGAKVLRLHPLISMREGELYAKKKYMGGLERCIKSYIADLRDEYRDYDRTRCFITHSSCEKSVVDLAKQIVSENFDFDEVYETVAGCVVTGHCGKNTLGVLFICL